MLKDLTKAGPGLACLAVFAVGLTGCETVPVDNSHELTRSVWQLHEVVTEGGTKRLTPAQSEVHTLEFYEGGDMALGLDCNNGRTTWSGPRPIRGAGSFSIGQIAATRALCPKPSWGEDMALDLPTTTSYELSRNGDRLKINARRVSYVFDAR